MKLPHHKAKPPWLPRFNWYFEQGIAKLEPHERDRFFVLMVHEIARRMELYRVGLLPAAAVKAKARA